MNENLILMPDSLAILRNDLEDKLFSDKQLSDVAVFMTSPILELGAALGAADSSPMAHHATANLLARTTLADFINTGCVSIAAVSRYMERAKELFEADEKKD